MTIRKAIRLSTLLGCMVACLVYAKAQTPEAANTTTNTVPTQPQNQASFAITYILTVGISLDIFPKMQAKRTRLALLSMV